MRVLLFLFILLSSVAVNAQNIMANKIFANSELYIPLRDTNWIPSRNGAFTMRPADGMIYTYNSSYTGAKWRLVTVTPGGGGGGAVNSVFGRSGDVTALSSDYSAFYLQLGDTAAMLLPYLRKIDTTEKWISYGWLSNLLKYSDTPSMLSPYLRKIDTTGKWIGIAWLPTLAGKQDALVSGTNIKTVNSNSILGSGNLTTDQLLPSQTGNSGKYLKSNGTTATWENLVLGDSTASRIRRGTFAQRPTNPDTGAVFYQIDRKRGFYSYDPWNAKWQFYPEESKVEIQESFMGATANGIPKLGGLFSGTGSGASINREKKYGNFLRLTTGTTTTGYSSYEFFETNTPTMNHNDSLHLWREWWVRIPTLSDATDNFSVAVGWLGHQAAWTYMICGFFHNYANNSGNWETRTRKYDNSANMTYKNTGVAPIANSWALLAIEYNGYTQTIYFYINNTLVTTHSTAGGDNIPMPNATSVSIQYNYGIAKSAGTNARFLDIREPFYYILKREY